MTAIIHHCPLPLELIHEILLRLPVKSLLRFLTVCKQWYDIITSTGFMHNHFHHENNQARLLVNWFGQCKPESIDPFDIQGFSLFMDETLGRHEEPDHLQLPGQPYAIVGPCNGVFCVTNNTCDKLALWNLSTKKLRPLPAPQRFHKKAAISFGVDPLTDEFKIVLIHSLPHFSIYTSSNDSWRSFENEEILRYSNLVNCEGTFFKGFSHWIEYFDWTSTSSLFTFDMRNEVFLDIEMPDCCDPYHEVQLDLFDDSLAVICYYDDIDKAEGKCVDVWVMKEQGCWIRSFSLRLPFNFRFPLGFWTSSNILLSTWDEDVVNEELVLYGLDSGSTRIVTVPFRDDARDIQIYVFNYKESLFPVKGGNETQDYDIQSVVSREFFSHR